MLKSRLGFGMMRLPVKNGDPTDFDYEQLNEMVDNFMAAGYTYFDTSYVYHNGKSEEAVRKAVADRAQLLIRISAIATVRAVASVHINISTIAGAPANTGVQIN